MWVEFPWVKYPWMNLPDDEKMFGEFSVGELALWWVRVWRMWQRQNIRWWNFRWWNILWSIWQHLIGQKNGVDQIKCFLTLLKLFLISLRIGIVTATLLLLLSIHQQKENPFVPLAEDNWELPSEVVPLFVDERVGDDNTKLPEANKVWLRFSKFLRSSTSPSLVKNCDE